MPDLSLFEVAARVVLAAVLGGAVGAEREIRERAAGLRTHLLVAVGAALFTLVSAYAWHEFTFSTRRGITYDPTRIAAQIVSGIGFLGAGAIIRQGLSVRGLTTAATLWAVAAIGMAAGAGYYGAAVITTALVLFTLWPLRILAYQLFARLRADQRRLVVEVSERAAAAPVIEALDQAGAETKALAFEDIDDGRRRIAVDLELPARVTPAALVSKLMDRREVMRAEWAD
jgi:putative Mg2+ transporter-C (MgtC) family protein